MKRPVQIILIALAFDLYWTLVVLFRERGLFLWIALAILACLMLPPTRRLYALLLGAAGCALDVFWAATGFIVFRGGAWLPLWMMALWLMFSTVWTRVSSLSSLPKWVLMLMATLGGPVAYLLGQYLGAIVFLKPTFIVVTSIAVGWLGLMFIFHVLVEKRS